MKNAGGVESMVLGRQAVNTLSPQELFNELVDDACGSVETPLQRLIPALTRIAARWNSNPDKVFMDVIAAKTERTGNGRMPGTSPDYRGGDLSPNDLKNMK